MITKEKFFAPQLFEIPIEICSFAKSHADTLPLGSVKGGANIIKGVYYALVLTL